MYIYMYVHLNVCIHGASTLVQRYYVLTSIYTRMCMYVDVCVCIVARMHMYVHACVCMYARAPGLCDEHARLVGSPNFFFVLASS